MVAWDRVEMVSVVVAALGSVVEVVVVAAVVMGRGMVAERSGR